MKANMSLRAYDVWEAQLARPEPEWPDLTFDELIRLAFRDRIVDRPDHPLILRLCRARQAVLDRAEAFAAALRRDLDRCAALGGEMGAILAELAVQAGSYRLSLSLGPHAWSAGVCNFAQIRCAT